MAAKPEAAPATPDDYEAYQTIVQAVSAGIQKGVNSALDGLQSEQGFTEFVQEHASDAEVAESMPDPADVSRLYEGFWKLASGLEADLHWKSVSGVPERSYTNAREVRTQEASSGGATPGDTQEISIGVSAFGFGIGVSW